MLGMYRDYVQWKKIQFFSRKGVDCEPYRSREDLYSDKIAIKEKKSFFAFWPKQQAQYWHSFDKNSTFLFNYIDIFWQEPFP